MKKIKVLLDFVELSVAEKIRSFRNIIAKMKANATTFAQPDESLDNATKAVDALEAASIAAAGGGRAATAHMHEQETVTTELFRILAAYVDRIAKGDESIILLSGFEPSKQPVMPQKPDLAAVDGSKSGSVKLIAKAVKNAGSYIWQMAKDLLPADESGWTTVGYTTQASNEVEGLESAKRYYFRVAAITTDGTTDFTDPVNKVVE